MSNYIDCTSPILYGRYGNYPSQIFGSGRRRKHLKFGGMSMNKTEYSVGLHPHHVYHPLKGGNSARQYWDYPNATSRANAMKTQYGGSDNCRPLPPRYRNHTAYEVGNNYIGGYTQSLNTYIGGRRRKRGGWISQKKAYQAY